jgi:hypothetical protein
MPILFVTSLFCSEDGGIRLLRNFGNFLPDLKCHIQEDGILELLLCKPQNLTVTGNFKTQIDKGEVLWEVIYCSNGKLPEPCAHTLPLLNFAVNIQEAIQIQKSILCLCQYNQQFAFQTHKSNELNGSVKAAQTV